MAYPIELDLTGRRVLVVGGGTVAARKVVSLVEAGARVCVVAARFDDQLDRRDDIERRQRPYDRADLDGVSLVFVCTDDRDVNARIAADARDMGIWCCIADDPEASDFHTPAVLRRGAFTIAVGTGGAAPMLAARARDRLQSHFGPEYAILVDELARARRIVKERVPDPRMRRQLLEDLCGQGSIDLLMERGAEAWRQWFEKQSAALGR